MDNYSDIFGPLIFVYIIVILLVIFILWQIGKLIGKHLPQTAGLIIGIVLILCGFGLFMGISCIIYSNKNKDKSNVIDLRINDNANSNIQNTINVQDNNTKECPYCAEIIKKNAKLCRYCGKDLSSDSENKEVFNNINIDIERLEKLFESTTDENEKGIIAKKLYDLGKIYYWRFIPR